MADDDSTSELTAPDSASSSALREAAPEPPVVARLVIEIRSDGTRTVARGALEDTTLGERVTVEAHGTTPLALAAKLSRSLLTTPLLARQLSKAAGGLPRRVLEQRASAEEAHGGEKPTDRGPRTTNGLPFVVLKSATGAPRREAASGEEPEKTRPRPAWGRFLGLAGWQTDRRSRGAAARALMALLGRSKDDDPA
ncbi:MAG: hypothetical protein KIT72_00190 [Polyangiaceae bacterium]|nr:hypothetical protein [Polyangiaceae bacterium]MCW5788814.1 hypothetical protein [Polyangiaceae bacterium]